MAKVKKQYDIQELSEVIRKVSYQVRKHREQEEISQSELSRRSGVSQTTINEIENGVSTDLQLSTLVQLAKAMKVSLLALLSETDLVLTDPDRKEFLRAAEEMERSFKVMDRLRQRIK